MSPTLIIQRALLILGIALSGGCTQLIVITPDSVAGTKSHTVPHKVGLYISPTDMMSETRHTRGAGGDTVAYLAYRDLETPIYAALRDSFLDVARLDSLADPIIQKERITLRFVPKIETTSVSGAFGMWAPTEFSVTITGDFVSIDTGAILFSVAVTGKGAAAAGELMGSPYRAARRASAAAVQSLRDALAAQAIAR